MSTFQHVFVLFCRELGKFLLLIFATWQHFPLCVTMANLVDTSWQTQCMDHGNLRSMAEFIFINPIFFLSLKKLLFIAMATLPCLLGNKSPVCLVPQCNMLFRQKQRLNSWQHFVNLIEFIYLTMAHMSWHFQPHSYRANFSFCSCHFFRS